MESSTSNTSSEVVNPVVQQLADRLRRSDSTLTTTLSLRRLPVVDVSPGEVLHILKAMDMDNSSSSSSALSASSSKKRMSATSAAMTASTEFSDDDLDLVDEDTEDPYADDVSLACPVTALHMWLPDHASNLNRSSTLTMALDSSVGSSFGTDSNDGDFFGEGSLNSSISDLRQRRNNDSIQEEDNNSGSMDWEERGNASSNTVVMNDAAAQAPPAAAAVLIENDTDDEDYVQVNTRNQRHQENQPPRQDDQNVRLPPPDYSLLTKVLANNSSIEEIACSSAANAAAWKTLFRGVGRNHRKHSASGSSKRGSITTLELGDSCLIADPTTLEVDACRSLAEHVLRSSNNNGKKTRSGIQNLILRSFSLPLQGVEYMARGFETNDTLQSIELQQIETDPGSFGRLLESLASCDSVKKIVLADCDLGINMLLDDHPLTLLLECSESLEVLRMTECQVTAVELQAMAAATPVSGKPTLKVLDLRGNELGPETAPALAQLIRKQTSLEKVILEDNQLDDAALKILNAAIADHPSLKKMNLRGNRLTSKSINHSLVLPKTLQVLDLSENELGSGTRSRGNSNNNNSAVGDWTGFFRANTQHETPWSLVLEATSMIDTDLVSLCQGREQSSPTGCSVQSLNVGQNDFGVTGMTAMARLLASSSSSTRLAMQSLSLASCQLSDNDVAILAQHGLMQCPSLQQVFLGFNQIGDAGCRSLAMALASKACCVKELQLQFNPFGVTGLGYLVKDGLKHNVYIQQLGIMNASIAPNEDEQLLSEMKHWLSLNRAGARQALCAGSSLSASIWPTVLAKADKVTGPTALYYLLQEQSSRMAS